MFFSHNNWHICSFVFPREQDRVECRAGGFVSVDTRWCIFGLTSEQSEVAWHFLPAQLSGVVVSQRQMDASFCVVKMSSMTVPFPALLAHFS